MLKCVSCQILTITSNHDYLTAYLFTCEIKKCSCLIIGPTISLISGEFLCLQILNTKMNVSAIVCRQKKFD